MRHIVTFQRSTQTRNDEGEPIDAWAALDTDNPTRRCGIYPIRGKEFWTGKQLDAEITHKLVTYYDSGISSLRPKDRVLFGTRIFDIQAVWNVDEANRQIDIMATERI